MRFSQFVAVLIFSIATFQQGVAVGVQVVLVILLLMIIEVILIFLARSCSILLLVPVNVIMFALPRVLMFS